MAPVAMLILMADASASQPNPYAGRSMSERRGFEGVYVTNFEISYFVECRIERGECAQWVHQESRWLGSTRPGVDAQFTECISRWNGSPGRWALYAITFNGRETLDRRPTKFLHDTERYVLLDEIIAIEMIGTDVTEDWALPRFRHRPVMKC